MAKTIQKCEYCGFCTKNVYIFKRHKLRCRKDHGIGKGKKVPANQQLTDNGEEAVVPGPSADIEDAVESGPENAVQEPGNVPGGEPENNDGSKVQKEKPAVNRNYACSKCEFKTNKSRTFLYHMVEQHKSKFDIFACSICEYCTRYRHKVQRHTKFAHKIILRYDEVQTEYVSTDKAKAAPVKPIHGKPKKPLMSRAMPGRKLMVKFMKKDSGENVKKQLKAPMLNMKTSRVEKSPCKVQSSGQLSRVVEETVGENGEVIFKCKECQFISDDKQKVAKHAISWHVDTKSFSCSHCDFITFERGDFLSHKLTHRNKQRFVCDECTYSSNFKPNYQRHRQNHRANLLHKCPLCTYSSGNESSIKRHISSNHDTLPAAEDKVKLPAPKSQRSPIKSSIEDNSNSLTNKASCDVSPSSSQIFKSTSYGASNSSLLFNINFDPSSASMVPRPTLPPPNFESMQLLMKELSPMRKLPPNISKYVERENGKLVCPACKLKYKRSSDLNRHMKRKHGCKLREFLESDQSLPPLTDDTDDSMHEGYGGDLMNIEDDDIDDDDDDDDGYLDQDDAGDDSEYASNTEQGDNPMDLSGKSDGDSPSVSPESLKCKYCTFRAKWPSDLRRHMAVHSIEKRFKCTYCTKKYKYIGDMNVHIRREHKKEPKDVKVVKVATIPRKKTSPALFKCPCCNYTSAWKSEIDRHTRLHTGDKTFQCGQCDYQTFWRGDIRRHVYKHHPDIMKDDVAIDDVITILKKTPEKMELKKDESDSKESSPETVEIETLHEEPAYSSTEDSTPYRSIITIPSMEVSSETHAGSSQSTLKSPNPHMKEIGGGMYKCEHCEFTANAPSKLNSHIATHTNIKRYMCPLCGKRANWKWDISKHIRKDHNDQVTQVIKLSRQAAEDTIQEYMETNLVVKRDHHLNTPDKSQHSVFAERHFYKCSRCDYSEERRISVARHIRYQHLNLETQILLVKSVSRKRKSSDDTKGNPLYAANTPAAITPSKVSKLAENSGGPDAGRPFMCSECGKKGATKGDIKKHYHYLHADKEIRIIYLGDGSQSVYSPKSEMLQSKLDESSNQVADSKQSPDKPDNQLLTPTPPRTSNPGLLPTVEPRALGYIRPFQCGYCGRRSNWKWDISKHVRERHPGQDLKIITLSEQEARATVKDYVKQQVPKLNKISSSGPRVRKGKSLSPAKEGLQDMDVEQSPEKFEPQAPLEPVNPYAGIQLSDTVLDLNNMPTKGVHRQFKCSDCPYRSNWRPDVQRHISRIHKDDGSFVIMLKEDVAAATIYGYQYKRGHDKGRSEDELTGGQNQSRSPSKVSGPLPRKAWAGLEKKLWKCSMCPYSNEDKVDVLKHLVKHNMKAYKCTLCNWSANFRSGVYRHIQNKHPGDKSALCRLAIKLIKEGPGNDELGQAIVPGQAPSTLPSPSTKPKPNQPSIEAFMRADAIPANDVENVNKTRKVVYHCKLCTTFRSKWRSCVCRHLRQAHDNREYTTNCIKKIIKVAVTQSEMPVPTHISSPDKHLSSTGQPKQPRSKNFVCALCPYRSYKAKMLRFHERCHTPQPGVKQFKCKHCPYYVNRNRLLSQHIILHMKGYNKPQKEITHPTSPGVARQSSESKSPAGPKRHRCEKCPYASNSKNDFLYHKQFHRPKPTADFKCDYCEYWVTHRRLLKQHMKVHGVTADYVSTPTKSELSENAYVYDTVEIAEIKQRIIASKITPSISQSPIVSPMKIASGCSMGGKRGFLRKDGTYRKIHRCHHCPYMNIRLRNMRLHELMHGKRPTTHALIKCPHCDYHVGSKGLLAHHLKVHQQNYDMVMLGMEKEFNNSLASEDSEMDMTISVDNKVDTLLEIARYKKYGCEKCPYASAKKNRFQRHVELHGSKQKCKCDYCDYSVPSANLLQQHLKLHFEPNQNLLAAQTILNLQSLPEMPADVALASMMTNNDSKNPVSITHDHIDLFENAPEDAEPKKIYRCDRCPYANVRRDNLLAHLRCHMTKNEYVCPYCDYSVGKSHVLVQHVKVHFSPLPELAEWVTENGDPQRMKEVKVKNITEVLEVMKMLQTDKQKLNGKDAGKAEEVVVPAGKDEADKDVKSAKQKHVKNGGAGKQPDDKVKTERTETDMDVDANENVPKNVDDTVVMKRRKDDDAKQDTGEGGTNKSKLAANDGATSKDETKGIPNGTNGQSPESYVCQYCDRDLSSSDILVQHEMQHLIGNSYEDMVSQLLEAASVLERQEKAMTEGEASQGTSTVVMSDTSSDKHFSGDGGSEGVFIVNQKGEKIGEVTPVKQQKRKLGDAHIANEVNAKNAVRKIEIA